MAKKVGTLKQQLDDPTFPHITCQRGTGGRRGAGGGRPWPHCACFLMPMHHLWDRSDGSINQWR